MSTINGLPAHVLLVHFIVVLAPLTAILLILCAVWSAARSRLIWPTTALAAAVLVLTPLTTGAGERLAKRTGKTPILHEHTELGDTMIYFAVALFLVAVALAVVHVREQRALSVKPLWIWLTAALAVVVGVATTVQVYRIGESGATSVWGDKGAAEGLVSI